MRICEYCGNEFIPKQERSKYCSRECQIRGFHQSRPKGATKKCEYCGKEFFTEHRGTKYCSPSCRRKTAAEQRKASVNKNKVTLEPKECRHCKKEFIPREKRQIYCSKECSAIYKRLEYRAIAEERKKAKEEERKRLEVEKKSSPKKKVYLYKKYDGIEDVAPKPKQIQKLSPASRRWAKMSWIELTKELEYYKLKYTDAQLMAKNNTLPKDFGLKRKAVKR